MHKLLKGVSLLLLGWPWCCPAQDIATGCYIPPTLQSYFDVPKPSGSGIAAFQELGMTYLQLGCTTDARAAFQQELREANPQSTAEHEKVAEIVNLLYSYTKGVEAYKKGDVTSAITIFSSLSQSNNPTFIQAAAATSYADLMMHHFDVSSWDDLRRILIRYENDGYWKGRFYLTFCGLDASNASSRTDNLRDLLAAPLPTETRLADEIILAGLLVETNHLLEADLMTKSIEQEVGTKALVSDLRFYYLQLCLSIASRLAGAGDAAAASRVLIYQEALEHYFATN